MKPVRTPVFPIWLEIQTYAGRPVKIPVPPLTCVVRSPKASQLHPRRGEQRTFVEGRLPVEYCTSFPSSSLKVRASASAFVKAVFPKDGISSLSPRVSRRLSLTCHSSCPYIPA